MNARTTVRRTDPTHTLGVQVPITDLETWPRHTRITSDVDTVIFMRVLVVEDHKRMAALVKRGLEEEGYSVDIAVDGAEAVWSAAEVSYDAVVLDVMLPELDGFEVCRQIRTGGCWAPVLMLTARKGVADRVHGLDAGADDYLEKPFSFVELAARLRALIRRGSPIRPTVLQVGDLRLDPATHQVWRGETELLLTAKEFALLQLFLAHPGEVSDLLK